MLARLEQYQRSLKTNFERTVGQVLPQNIQNLYVMKHIPYFLIFRYS